MAQKLRLICKMKDGRILSGSYPYLAAIARKLEADRWPDCEMATLEEVPEQQ